MEMVKQQTVSRFRRDGKTTEKKPLRKLAGSNSFIKMLFKEKIKNTEGIGYNLEYSSLLTVESTSKKPPTTSVLTAKESVLTVKNKAIQLSFLKWGLNLGGLFEKTYTFKSN